MSVSPLQSAIRRLAAGESLSAADTMQAFAVIMRGEASDAQVAALLMALRVKGETAEEVAGGALALRNAMVKLPARDPARLVDTCGTGGGKVPTFNISTAAALLAAGAGVRIAKHGNRSFTSRCGSADVLEALGVPVEITRDAMSFTLDHAGIVFMFAPIMHPAMKHVGPVRRELGIPTVMNVLGPLANPAGAGRQVVGVAEPHRMHLLAGALAALGTVRALVVHGEPGLDEVSPLGCTSVREVRDGAVREWTIDPAHYDLDVTNSADLAGGTPSENARVIVDVLSGRLGGGARAAVVLNAAAALYVSAEDMSYDEAIGNAQRALQNEAGLGALERLREAVRQCVSRSVRQ